MDIARAFTFVFEDKQAAEKLVITAIIGFLSLILTPLLVGFVGWAAILGYQIELVRNIRRGVKYPLPRWDNFNQYVSDGLIALIAFLIYSIPTVIIGGFTLLLAQGAGNTFVGSALFVVVGCCFTPLLLIYNLLTLPMLTLAQGRYTEKPTLNTYFEIGWLLVTLRDHLSVVITWLVGVLVVNLAFAVLNAIPCIGTIAGVALMIPIQGALTGQLAREVLGPLKPNEKPKR